MKVICRHGHFAFYPGTAEDIARFQRLFETPIVAEADYFTFEGLLGLPKWSQVLKPYGLLPAVVTFEGPHASDVMRENSFVYSIVTGLLVPTSAITEVISLPQTQNAYLASKLLLQPGCVLTTGDRLLGYRGFIDLKLQRLYIYARELLA